MNSITVPLQTHRLTSISKAALSVKTQISSFKTSTENTLNVRLNADEISQWNASLIYDSGTIKK